MRFLDFILSLKFRRELLKVPRITEKKDDGESFYTLTSQTPLYIPTLYPLSHERQTLAIQS